MTKMHFLKNIRSFDYSSYLECPSEEGGVQLRFTDREVKELTRGGRGGVGTSGEGEEN